MTRRNAFRQCDVERAIRAAKATGAGRVIIRLDGSLEIEVEGNPSDQINRRTRHLKSDEYVL